VIWPLPDKYGMRFYEFATTKPKKPRKPLTPEQSMVAAKKRQVEIAKQALQNVKDQQKRQKEAERTRLETFTVALPKKS
jgi:hypothetical protein